MKRIYIISTNLHLFQAYHISNYYSSDKNVFYIEEGVFCSFCEELVGELKTFKRNDNYFMAVFLSFVGCMSRSNIRGPDVAVYFGNQVHSLVNYNLNKYHGVKCYLLDDGLSYYGKGLEEGGGMLSNKIRNILNRLLGKIKIASVSSRDYLVFPANVEVTLIFILLGIDGLRVRKELPLIPFSKFYSADLHDKIGMKYFKEKHYDFLSYSESSTWSGLSTSAIVLHPKYRAISYECPFEFVPSSKVGRINKSTSLWYIFKFLEQYEG